MPASGDRGRASSCARDVYHAPASLGRLARDKRTGRFCCGDQPTVADLCLVPHVATAKMLVGRDPDEYPNANRILKNCLALDAFSLVHPLKQPDAPKQKAH